MKRLLLTSALPYANGHIHIGHLVEYTQTDILARYWRMIGRRCIYLCADDTHGTAIMIRARQEGRSEADVIADMSAAHQRDFAAFQIRFDHYGSTNSPANRALCEQIWASLRERGMVTTKDVTQLFDPKEGMFLADRFVKGTCPKCGAADQYGDSCDRCGSTYAATDLVEPRSALTGARPEVRSAQHLMVVIEPERPFLSTWTQGEGRMPKEIANYLAGHFLSEPLRDWDVSRPAPYFGFEIPDAPGNYWYVWFDAPIGYMAASKEWCDREGEAFDDWWRSEETEIVHVIGKDIVYFHTLFWPAHLACRCTGS
jgi:methionyl-tRNA synthetase